MRRLLTSVTASVAAPQAPQHYFILTVRPHVVNADSWVWMYVCTCAHDGGGRGSGGYKRGQDSCQSLRENRVCLSYSCSCCLSVHTQVTKCHSDIQSIIRWTNRRQNAAVICKSNENMLNIFPPCVILWTCYRCCSKNTLETNQDHEAT